MREVLQKLCPQGRPTRDSSSFFFHPGFVFFSFSFPSFSGYFRVPENSTFLHQSILFYSLKSFHNPGTETHLLESLKSWFSCSSAPQMVLEWFCLSGRLFLAFYFAFIMYTIPPREISLNHCLLDFNFTNCDTTSLKCHMGSMTVLYL